MIIPDTKVNKYMQAIVTTLDLNDDLIRPAAYRRNLVIIEMYHKKLLSLIIDQYNITNNTNINIEDICKQA
jgi:hypothetical protein